MLSLRETQADGSSQPHPLIRTSEQNIKLIERRGKKLHTAIVRINAQVAQLSGAVSTRW